LIDNDGDGPFVYRLSPVDSTEVYHITKLTLVGACSDSGWNSTAFFNIAGGLSSGLTLRQRRLSDGEVLWAFTSRDNVDLFGRYEPQDIFNFTDDENLLSFDLKPGRGASISVTSDEVLEFVVEDNLSSLTHLRAYGHYGVEDVL